MVKLELSGTRYEGHRLRRLGTQASGERADGISSVSEDYEALHGAPRDVTARKRQKTYLSKTCFLPATPSFCEGSLVERTPRRQLVRRFMAPHFRATSSVSCRSPWDFEGRLMTLNRSSSDWTHQRRPVGHLGLVLPLAGAPRVQVQGRTAFTRPCLVHR